MSYSLGKREKNEIKITFDVDANDWAKAIDQSYEKNKFKYKLEGFRQGKVPKKMLEKHYGVGIFFDDALEIIIPEQVYGAVEAEKLNIVAQPAISLEAISDTTLKFSAVVTLRPEVKLGKYTGLDIKKSAVKVTKAEVDAKVKEALENAGSLVPVENRACKIGDTVEIAYSGSIDGVKFEGGTADNQSLKLGAGQFIPGFEEQIVGMKAGEEKDINVKFPEQYTKELAGKDAVFAIKLHNIRELVVPKLDDEFAKDVSEFDTLKEYKDSIEKEILKEKEEKAQIELENKILDTIAKSSKVDIPQAMIDDQIENSINEFETRLSYQGMKAEDYYKHTGVSRDDLKKQYAESSKINVLNKLVIEELLKELNIKVDDKKVDAKLEEQSKMYNIPVEKMLEQVPNFKDMIASQVQVEELFAKLVKDNVK